MNECDVMTSFIRTGDGPMRSEHQIVVYTESSDDTSTDGRIDTVKGISMSL